MSSVAIASVHATHKHSQKVPRAKSGLVPLYGFP